MADAVLASRRFTLDDQLRFAAASGDVNPMHVDPVAARRTQAGSPAVHGVNALLWALDRWLDADRDARPAHVAVQFEKFILLDRPVELRIRRDAAATILEVADAEQRLIAIKLRDTAPPAAIGPVDAADPVRPAVPIDLSFEDARTAAGAIALTGGAELAALYPVATARLGIGCVTALAGLSYIVGMVVPGLHSIFASIDATLGDGDPDRLDYRVVQSNELFRLLSIDAVGGGVSARIKAFLRKPPVAQTSCAELRRLVAPSEFSGIHALVVGGSRGIGEVTAKLLAAGGASVAISYAVGAVDADRVARDIRDAGGDCTVLPLDVTLPIALQLAAIRRPDQLYYFATPRIAAQTGLYDRAAYDGFTAIYVDAFLALCTALASKDHPCLAFYPSSVFVEERPKGMTGYAMAKAAAELLCADIDRFLPGMRTLVRRLPRLQTDQTASVTASDAPDPADAMLEAVRAMMAMKA